MGPIIGANIYILKKGGKELPEPLIRSRYDVRGPALTAKGRIFFEAWAYKPDGSGDNAQYFEYSPDGNHRRITKNSSLLWEGAVSQDGRLLAIVTGGQTLNISIYNLDDGTVRDILLPEQTDRVIFGSN